MHQKYLKSPDAPHQPRHVTSPWSSSVITSHRWKQQNSHVNAVHQSTSPNLRTHDSVEKFLEPADARRRMIRGWKESNATHVKVNANVKPKLYYNPVHFLPSFHPSILPSFLSSYFYDIIDLFVLGFCDRLDRQHTQHNDENILSRRRRKP